MQGFTPFAVIRIKHLKLLNGMKIKFTHWYNALLAALLALLGFDSCIGENGGGTVEYGTPSVSFQVKGNVKSSDGKPIRGIRVISKIAHDKFSMNVDTAYTDTDGNFESKKLGEFSRGALEQELMTLYEDVDGKANGEFEKDSLEGSKMIYKQTEKGEGNWYNGHYEVTADKTLKEKKP
jgi:putative lipoprotein (rSAM/lipoprotein system)